MQIRDIISQMAQRAFSFQFHDGILDMYSARDYGATEPDYETGFNYLASILTEDQKQALNHMENTYIVRRNYAAEYGFKCGMYGAFRQFFGSSGALDGGFDDLVGNDLLMQPKMQRHHESHPLIPMAAEPYLPVWKLNSKQQASRRRKTSDSCFPTDGRSQTNRS